MTTITILGSGTVATALAGPLHAAGHQVIIDLGGVHTALGREAFLLMVRSLVGALGPVPFGMAVAR
ncbi:hypothetical protein [Actinoalloteichus hymeniacidonis]|uniref:Uncharacterized protein n=1 Tax=Actinoalloteichus hymeniacidonis TaxID=340345 RepID=A0AAC9HME8_9PSEU|nr:hypothetical protein [Actinoalloteichus hymeniacidonis]AOS62032.1 hypothetical protein TL08_06035 [Actinoalloteichus hymeniacidonis]MBB5909946.1 putative dinucleotide-binding enzyme [Actinoalloteichus hymeniacidonis]